MYHTLYRNLYHKISEFWLIEHVQSTTNLCDLFWVAVRVSMLKSPRDRQVWPFCERVLCTLQRPTCCH